MNPATRLTVLALLSMGLFITFTAAFVMPGPIRAGNVVSKDFRPAHTMVAGKTVIYYDDSWHIKISQCTDTAHCQTATYTVSEEEYNSTAIGDEKEFTVEDNIWRWLTRVLLLIMGFVGLGMAYFCAAWMLDSIDRLEMIFGTFFIIIGCILGYEPVTVPALAIDERLEFVLEHIQTFP